MSNQSKVVLLLIALLLLPACLRRSQPPPQQQGGDTQRSPANFPRVAGNNQAVEYGWDGQASSITLVGAMATYRVRAVAGLRAMDFVINEEASQTGHTTAVVEAAKTDHTTATVWLDEKEGKTTVRVKVGSLGDRTGSERVLDEIQRAPGKKK
jgi:hypothetical protein